MGLTDKNAGCHSQYRLMSCHVIPPSRLPGIGRSASPGKVFVALDDDLRYRRVSSIRSG